MERKKVIILSIVVGLIALGFILGIIVPPSEGCTEKACFPSNVEGRVEIPCNECFITDPIFMLGVINYNGYCSGTQIWIFENNEQSDQRIDINSCTYGFTFFKLY